MRIVAIHRYFWPDTPPYGLIIRNIAHRWTLDGHEVRLLAGRPSEPPAAASTTARNREVLDGISVERLWVARETPGTHGQFWNLVGFPLLVAGRLISGPKPDVIMCSTAPQVTLAWVVSWVARMRGAHFVYHCMDLQPEIGHLSGDFSHPVLYRMLAHLDLGSMKRASRIIVLSRDMAKAISKRDESLSQRVEIIQNFALSDSDTCAISPLPPPASGTLRVVFTGNIGRFQGLEALVGALGALPGGTPIELVFMGEGKAKDSVAAAAHDLPAGKKSKIIFLPHGSVGQARALMGSAHVGVVSVLPGVIKYASPSKFATYAAEGLPMLVMCELESALVESVRRERIGWAVRPGDVEATAIALLEAHREKADGSLDARRERVRRYANNQLSQEKILNAWSYLTSSLSGEVATG